MPVQIFNADTPTAGPDGVQQCHDVFVFVDEGWAPTNPRLHDVDTATDEAAAPTAPNFQTAHTVDGQFRVEDDEPFPGPYFWGNVNLTNPGDAASSQVKGNPDESYVRVTLVSGGPVTGNLNDNFLTAPAGTQITVDWQRAHPTQTKDDVTVTSDDPGSVVTEVNAANGQWQVCRTDTSATHNTTLTATNDVDATTAQAPADFTFGDGGAGPTNPNNVDCHSDNPDAIQHTQARMCMTADNVDPTDHLVVEYATTPGGPYTVQSVSVVGDNTVGQQFCNTFTGLTPSTDYYFRGTVRQGAANGPIISAGPECSLTTTADPHYVSDACTGNNAQNVAPVQRDTVAAFIQMSRQPIVEDFTMLIEESVNGSPFAPIPPAAMYREGDGTAETANPVTVPNVQTVRWYMTQRYEPGDSVQFRYTGYLDGVATNDVCESNVMTTADVPELQCDVGTVDMTTADVSVRITNTDGINVEPWGGHWDSRGPNPPDDPDNVDDVVFRYGTTPGGPYPNEVTVQPGDSFSDVTANLTGLTDDTDYYFRVDLEDKPDGLIAFSNECTFRTLNDETNDGPFMSVIPAACAPTDDAAPEPAEPSTSVDDECLQDDNGVFFRRVQDDGEGNLTVTTVDVAGDPYTPVGAVEPCGGAEQEEAAALTLDAETVAIGPGQSWTPGNVGGRLVGVSLTVVDGSATVVDADGTSVGPLPTGTTMEWSVNEDRNTLNGPQSIAVAGAVGTTIVAWTEEP